MIYGIGTDLCDVLRVSKVLEKQGQRFIDRILTEEEQCIGPQKKSPAYIAKRWAGKEAVSKALGVGIGEELSFHDISILTKASGQPYITLSNKAQQTFPKIKLHISLSDEEGYALAYVIAESL